MGVDNQGSKAGGYVGGFFQLFDWTGKSRKKLLSNRLAVPEGSKHGNQSDGKLPIARLLMIGDENGWGLSNAKESNSSCASSITDDEGSGIRVPGVVARLMGLDSLPSADVSEPQSDPVTKFHTLPNAHYQRRSPEFQIEYQGGSSNNLDNKIEGFPQKAVESRPQKLQKTCLPEKSPIERFQTETLPPKSAKSQPRIHNKLLSPIKSPGFVSAKNAAQLMEAATKIIQPGLQASSRNKYPILGSSAIPVKDRDVEGNMSGSQRQSRPLEALRRPVESSAIKYLKGQSMNKSWNGSDDAPNLRAGSEERVRTFVPSLPECKFTAAVRSKVPVSSSKQELAFPDESKSAGLKDKGKSISLAVQAKVNVQRRESLSSGSSLMPSQNSCNKTLLVQKVHDEPKFNQPLNNQPSNLKNKQKKPVPGSSGVLRLNNQKQNCLTSKDKLLSKPATSNQQGRKVVSGDASVGREQRKQTNSKDHAVSARNSNNPIKNVTSTKVSGNSNYGFKEKASTGTPELEKNISSSRTKNFVRKKRCMEGDVHPEKNRFVDEFFVDGVDRLLPINAAMGECPKWREDNIRSLWNSDQTASSCSKSMDVVSFTFTSPMMPIPGSHSSIQTLEKKNMKSNVCADSHAEKSAPDPKNKNMSTSGSSVAGGDALSILLEQKLRELTSGAELDSNSPKVSNSGTVAATATASLLQDLISALNNGRVPKEHEMKHLTRLQNDNLGHKSSESECSSSTYGQMMFNTDQKLHGPEAITDCGSSTSICAQKECIVYDHPSPMSILESSFSSESCNSSQSWDSIHGCRHYPIFTENLVGLGNPKQIQSPEAEAELSDSATSTLTQTTERENSTKMSFADGHMRSNKNELEYVREIINSADLMFEDFAVGHASGIIEPHFFEGLENRKILSMVDGENKEIRGSSNKVLFDCIRESTDSKYSRYSSGGYRAWVRGGMALMGGRNGLAEEVYKEIMGWSTMGDWMVDEIVEKDMSSHLGTWTDFETEKFEIGVEIEEEILQALVDEVVMDVFV